LFQRDEIESLGFQEEAIKYFNFNSALNSNFLIDQNSIYKNAMNHESSIFLAFVSTCLPEDSIVDLSIGKRRISFTTKKIEGASGEDASIGEVKNGVIISTMCNLIPSRKNNFVRFNRDLLSDKEDCNEQGFS